MKTIALFSAMVFSLTFAGGQTYPNPLVVTGTYSVKGNQTTYVVEFLNSSKSPIEDLKIRKVGLALHYREFRPVYCVPAISAGKRYTLTVNLRGAIFGADAQELVSVEGSYSQGTRRYSMFFHRRKDCWPSKEETSRS